MMVTLSTSRVNVSECTMQKYGVCGEGMASNYHLASRPVSCDVSRRDRDDAEKRVCLHQRGNLHVAWEDERFL